MPEVTERKISIPADEPETNKSVDSVNPDIIQ
jgi:hypothetical protein